MFIKNHADFLYEKVLILEVMVKYLLYLKKGNEGFKTYASAYLPLGHYIVQLCKNSLT